MAAGSDNPLRQAMINMMYLVLLALLALNVSAQVLNAFEVVHSGIQESNSSLETKNESSMIRFEDLLNNNKELTKPHYDRAEKVQDVTGDLESYIQSLREEIVTKSGGYLLKEGDTTDQLVGAKNLDVGSRILVEQGKGDTLQQKINRTADKLKGILQEYNENDDAEDDIPQSKIDKLVTLQAEDPPDGPDNKNSWAAQRFQMIPVTAAVTILSKVQSDIKSTKADIINQLLNQVSAGRRSFDRLIPIVRPEKSVVNVNEQFKAEIMLGAYSSTQDPTIVVEGQKIEDIENGRGTFKTTPSTAGEKEREGMIMLPNPTTGGTDSFPLTINFKASPSFATISADAMNVLYTGLENPISIGAVGYRPEQTSVTISKGSLVQKGEGNYVATVPEVRNTTISVAVTTKDGNTKQLGSKEFRVRRVPNPRPLLAGKTSGDISEVKLKNAQAVVAAMSEGFAFEGVKYKVTSFRFTYVPTRGNVREAKGQGPRLTGKMKNILSDLSTGDRVLIDAIRAKGPDGVKNLPASVNLKVQ